MNNTQKNLVPNMVFWTNKVSSHMAYQAIIISSSSHYSLHIWCHYELRSPISPSVMCHSKFSVLSSMTLLIWQNYHESNGVSKTFLLLVQKKTYMSIQRIQSASITQSFWWCFFLHYHTSTSPNVYRQRPVH